MALQVDVYTVEARKREDTPYPATDFYTYDYQEAQAYAQRERLIVIVNHYEFEDSEPLDDFTEDDNGE